MVKWAVPNENLPGEKIMEKENRVIAVSSVSGGGKSTVVRKLVDLLDDAVAIHFDDYETPETYPQNPAVLLERGTDFNVIKSPLLAQHLQALRRGEAVVSPAAGGVVAPARYIVYAGPLGRAQHETGQYIDYLVFIDTPLDVGLARRLSRTVVNYDVENMSREELQRALASLGRWAEDYCLWMRRGYMLQRELVRPGSDLILDGEQPAEALAQAIVQALAEVKWA
jgi:uridine kinase